MDQAAAGVDGGGREARISPHSKRWARSSGEKSSWDAVFAPERLARRIEWGDMQVIPEPRSDARLAVASEVAAGAASSELGAETPHARPRSCGVGQNRSEGAETPHGAQDVR